MANPFVHIELNTGDTAKAKKFYKSLFGWKLQDMPMGPGMTYTMIDVGEGVGGGITKKPMPKAPTMWLSYVQVDSVKKTMAKAAGPHQQQELIDCLARPRRRQRAHRRFARATIGVNRAKPWQRPAPAIPAPHPVVRPRPADRIGIRWDVVVRIS
jgi:catechol 2,3-dioxygenase-like lactoylglutathione lyase family enzyme